MCKIKVKRYDPIECYDGGYSSYGEMNQVEDGDYVRWEDVEPLLRRVEFLEHLVKLYETEE